MSKRAVESRSKIEKTGNLLVMRSYKFMCPGKRLFGLQSFDGNQ